MPSPAARQRADPQTPARPHGDARTNASAAETGFSLPSQAASASPSFSLPSASSAAPTEIEVAQVEPIAPEPEPAPRSRRRRSGARDDRGGGRREQICRGIDKLLATIAEAPPPPQPKLELTKPRSRLQTQGRARRRPRPPLTRRRRRKRPGKRSWPRRRRPRKKPPSLGVKGTYWVQLAGGSNQDRMATEYKKLAERPASCSSRVPAMSPGARIISGCWSARSTARRDSQAFVNKLEKEGVDGFSWTRTPPKIKIEKLSSR